MQTNINNTAWVYDTSCGERVSYQSNQVTTSIRNCYPNENCNYYCKEQCPAHYNNNCCCGILYLLLFCLYC